MPGSLFVVATPIGNLEDITLRALRILREVDVIAAEDTRRTAKLLAHYEIQKPVISVHEHNEARESGRLVDRLLQGESIALVSDAGTPTVADPGCHVVSVARRAGIKVVPIPGANAIVTALSAAGVPASEFVFLGFPPTSGVERERWLERLWRARETAVFYESPHRIERTLDDVSSRLVERQIIIGRELTKLHEELVNWNKESPISQVGEFVVVVPAADIQASAEPEPTEVAEMFGQIADSTKLEPDQVTAMVASHFHISPTRARNLTKKGAIELKRRRESTN